MDQFSTYLPGIILAHIAVLLALMSPGPNILAVIGTSMGIGRREGIALALGVACDTFLWVLLAVVGFTALIATFSTKPMVALYTKARRVIEAALGAFFCAMGIRLLTERN
jgi:threonine/homoserine/homoserine lactone efflux protein